MNKKIKILLVGDFCSIFPKELKVGSKLKQLITESDLRYLNFEGPLQVGKVCSANRKFLKQSADSPNWCIKEGFNIIGLANNHAYDFGEIGLKATANAFKKQVVVGCGKWKEAFSVKYMTIGEKRIGFLAATSADMSALKNFYEDFDKYGCAWINHSSMAKIIVEAKKQCDFLILLPHAGVEFMSVPLPEWREIYRSFIDLGCDAIIATHPHVPQGWEMYNEKPIFYSLGNFVFEKDSNEELPPNWNNGLCVVLELLNSKVSFKVISTLYKNNIIDIDESPERKEYINKLTKILVDDNVYINEVNREIFEFYVKYKDWLLDGFNAIEYKTFNLKGIYSNLRRIFKNNFGKKVALHQLREESTRWVICRALKLKTRTNL